MAALLEWHEDVEYGNLNRANPYPNANFGLVHLAVNVEGNGSIALKESRTAGDMYHHIAKQLTHAQSSAYQASRLCQEIQARQARSSLIINS